MTVENNFKIYFIGDMNKKLINCHKTKRLLTIRIIATLKEKRNYQYNKCSYLFDKNVLGPGFE